MSTPFNPHGTTLRRKNPSTGVYELVPQVIVTGFPNVTTEYDDTTTHDSTGGYKEKAPTLKEVGSIPCSVLFNPADAMHQQLFTDNEVGTLLGWRVHLPDANGVREQGALTEFNAYVASIENPADLNRNMRLGFNLQPSGKPTHDWTP